MDYSIIHQAAKIAIKYPGVVEVIVLCGRRDWRVEMYIKCFTGALRSIGSERI